MSASLVGSEMCIRDSHCARAQRWILPSIAAAARQSPLAPLCQRYALAVSYTHLTLPTICSV
eukprot:283699-Alexandrium_andersonii.AAC.1